MRAPGVASRIGEWLAITNWAPAAAARTNTATSASAPLTDSAASGPEPAVAVPHSRQPKHTDLYDGPSRS